MSNDYSIATEDGLLTLVMRGQVTYEICPQMKRELESHLEGGEITAVQVDMSGTTFLDSHGIGILVMLHKMTTVAGSTLTILRPSQETRKILDLVGLLAIFTLDG